MSKLATQIENALPKKITLPEEIKKLFYWIESIGCITEHEGNVIGYLPGDFKSTTAVEFYAETDTPQWWCFDTDKASDEKISERVFIFAKTGADGSSAAFWLDNDGKQKIVHIGSGSGSDMVCVLTENPIDFIKLLAIGYEEICWQENYSDTPNNTMNKEFKEWVKHSFDTSIPSKGEELVKNPAIMWDVDSPDPFCRWISMFNKDSF